MEAEKDEGTNRSLFQLDTIGYYPGLNVCIVRTKVEREEKSAQIYGNSLIPFISYSGFFARYSTPHWL